jgi:tRNA A37 threonylcarbamoyladenosine synthetase subunit TsaC/SUA5/YrdC
MSDTTDDPILEARIRRAMQSGPASITKDATVIDMDDERNHIVLREGTNSLDCVGDGHRA